MAFRTQSVPAAGLERAKKLASQVKSHAQGRSAEFASATSRDVILTTARQLRLWRDEFNTIASISGIGAYAADQENDGTYDVGAEFSAMMSAIDAVISEIVSAFPTAASGEVLERVLNADGTTTMRSFTAAQLSTLKGLMDDLAATID